MCIRDSVGYGAQNDFALGGVFENGVRINFAVGRVLGHLCLKETTLTDAVGQAKAVLGRRGRTLQREVAGLLH